MEQFCWRLTASSRHPHSASLLMSDSDSVSLVITQQQRHRVFALKSPRSSTVLTLAESRPLPQPQAASSSPLFPQASLGPPPDSQTAPRNPARHPQFAVLLGLDKRWHLPLLLCRALSTVPALWWGLRCALTCLGDLLLTEGPNEGPWDAERRFRITEVFLAVLWVSVEFDMASSASLW